MKTIRVGSRESRVGGGQGPPQPFQAGKKKHHRNVIRCKGDR